MTAIVDIIVRLVFGLLLLGIAAKGATVENVKLVGDANNYINIRSKTPYALMCPFRAGYDDPIISVKWYKDGRMVYTWIEGETMASAFMELSGRVFTNTKDNLQNIRFNNNLSPNLSGNYSCEVESKKETVKSNPFHLVVLDIPSDDFVSDVNILSEESNETLSNNENQNCTLVWDFKTPAIFPRPNVTCGYYSYLHDDVTQSLPAGLAMELLVNGSWQAGFEHTHIHVSDIPREERLGCSISVPDTTYKKVIKFEDNFVIDHLIDSEGCPSMFLVPEYRLKYTLEGGELNCRGDVIPFSSDEPVVLRIGCDPRDIAVFPNGSLASTWSTDLTCDQQDMTWRRVQNGVFSEKIRDIQNEVPMCVLNSNGGYTLRTSPGILFSFIAYFMWHCVIY